MLVISKQKKNGNKKKERESTIWKAVKLFGLGIWKITKKNHGVGASKQV